MLTLTVDPRFSETDALGHINNAVLPVWFETARSPLFEIFTPNLDVKAWRLILARIEVDFVAEMKYGSPVEIRTGVQKLGNSSFVVFHEAHQKGKLCAKGLAVMIHYNYETRKSEALPTEIREKLSTYLVHADAKGSPGAGA